MTIAALRIVEYLERVSAAAKQAIDFTEQMDFDHFASDARTQMAVTMALVLLGEAANRISVQIPDLTVQYPEIPWNKIRGMRNLIAHDYYEIEMPVIWRTVRQELPILIQDLGAMRRPHTQGE